jgi:phosphate transport system substrate-binding protein
VDQLLPIQLCRGADQFSNRRPPATAKEAYPIAGLTFLIIPKQAKSLEKAGAIKQIVEYMVTEGQGEAEKLSYAKLPAALQKQDENLLAQVAGQSNQASPPCA